LLAATVAAWSDAEVIAGTEQQGSLDRFFDEARVMASLRHPNVVAVLDLDEASRRIVSWSPSARAAPIICACSRSSPTYRSPDTSSSTSG